MKPPTTSPSTSSKATLEAKLRKSVARLAEIEKVLKNPALPKGAKLAVRQALKAARTVVKLRRHALRTFGKPPKTP